MCYSFSFLLYLDLALVLVGLFQESVHFPHLGRNQTLLSPCLSQEGDRSPGSFFLLDLGVDLAHAGVQ